MEEVYEWGLQVIRAIQTARCAPLDVLAKFIHVVFNSPIYIALILIYSFCFNMKTARKIGVSLFFSHSLISGIKDRLCVPRPYTRDPSVGLAHEESWSTPSGHATTCSAVLPVIAKSQKNWKKWVRIVIAVVLPLIIGVSRCYLGVHYPTDVLAGWALGFMVSLFVILFFDQIDAKLSGLRASIRILIVAVITFFLLRFDNMDSSMTGGFFGLELGYILLSQKGGFNAAKGTWKQKLLRLLIGTAFSMGFYLLGKLFFPSSGEFRAMFRFIRYGGTAFLCMYVAPLVVIKLGLGEHESAPVSGAEKEAE